MTLNTNATTSWRKKWMPNLLQEVLHNALVTEAIVERDTSNVFYIENPYGSAASVTQQAIAGTYTPASYTSTNDTLTLTDEFVWSEHIYSTEKVNQICDIKGSRMKEAMAQMATAIDKWVLNNLCEDGTGTYTTPVGGFTTPANIPKIIGDLATKFAGYAETFNGLYIVIESGDVTGFYQHGVAAGFSYADAWLKNGWVTSIAGFDIYVVRAGTFVSATLGTTAVTNDGHRVAGVKKITTCLMPTGKMEWEEKPVSSKRGVELMLAADAGFKAWYQKLALTVDITLA